MEYNFRLTKEEADRVVQALNNDAVTLINKLQSQFKEQEEKIENNEEILLEGGNENS